MRLSLGGTIYDRTDPVEKMFVILASFAEFGVDVIRMRARGGMAVARVKGRLWGRQMKLCARGRRASAGCTPLANMRSPTWLDCSPSLGRRCIGSWDVTVGGRGLAAGQKGGTTMDEFTITGSADPDGLRLRGSRPRPDTVRLAVTGAIDVSNASLLRARIQDAVDAGEAAAFELDLAGVPMLDSTGVGTLVACRAAAQRVGLRFAVVATRPIVYRILQVVGLIEALNVSMSAEPNGGESGRLRAAGGDAGDDPDGRS